MKEVIQKSANNTSEIKSKVFSTDQIVNPTKTQLISDVTQLLEDTLQGSVVQKLEINFYNKLYDMVRQTDPETLDQEMIEVIQGIATHLAQKAAAEMMDITNDQTSQTASEQTAEKKIKKWKKFLKATKERIAKVRESKEAKIREEVVILRATGLDPTKPFHYETSEDSSGTRYKTCPSNVSLTVGDTIHEDKLCPKKSPGKSSSDCFHSCSSHEPGKHRQISKLKSATPTKGSTSSTEIDTRPERDSKRRARFRAMRDRGGEKPIKGKTSLSERNILPKPEDPITEIEKEIHNMEVRVEAKGYDTREVYYPVELNIRYNINIMPHYPDVVCCASIKAWANFVKQVADNSGKWCGWITSTVEEMRHIAGLLRSKYTFHRSEEKVASDLQLFFP